MPPACPAWFKPDNTAYKYCPPCFCFSGSAKTAKAPPPTPIRHKSRSPPPHRKTSSPPLLMPIRSPPSYGQPSTELPSTPHYGPSLLPPSPGQSSAYPPPPKIRPPLAALGPQGCSQSGYTVTCATFMTSAWPGMVVSTQAPNGMILKAATLQGQWVFGSSSAFIAVQAASSYILAIQDGSFFKMVLVSNIPGFWDGSRLCCLPCSINYTSFKSNSSVSTHATITVILWTSLRFSQIGGLMALISSTHPRQGTNMLRMVSHQISIRPTC